MTRAQVLTRRIALALAALAAVGAVAAYATMTASANGRTLEGAFCTGLCMSINWDGVTYGKPNPGAELELRPGTYWFTVTDTSTFHNFSLRSCPDSTDLCTSANPAAGVDGVDEITGVPDTPGEVTKKFELKHGTYRLFCARPGHEAGGMFVDFTVAGVGQLDD